MEDSLRKIEKIESNHPSIDGLAIAFEGFSLPLSSSVNGWLYGDVECKSKLLTIEDDSIDWKRVSTAIQKSNVLKELHLGGIFIFPDDNDSNFRESDLRALMFAFANGGTQLTKLILDSMSVPFEILFSGEDCPGLLQRPGLHLVVSQCGVTPADIEVLIHHVSRGNSLAGFEFHNALEDGGHSSLMKLGILICYLTHHKQLKSLSIVGVQLTPPWICDIASMLEKPDSKLVGLELGNNGIGIKEFETIVESLSLNNTLRGLTYDNFDGHQGAQLIDRLLSHKDLRLMMLSTPGMQIADPDAAMLSRRLDSYGNLTYLQVELSPLLGVDGWHAFGRYIQSSTCILHQLNLPNSHLDDAKLLALSTWVSRLETMNFLHIPDNRAITVNGWRVFFNLVIENPMSNMEYIDISRCGIEDETINMLASALRGNRKLEGFSVVRAEDDATDVTKEGWGSFMGILCDRTSIEATYLSNHTLFEIDASEPLPAELMELLSFNIGNAKTVARFKVLEVHFAPKFDISAIRPLLAIDNIKLLPQVINWVGKDEGYLRLG